MATKETKELKKTRKAPDFSGVPGELVSLDPAMEFGKRKISPYDALLDKLSEATDDALAKGQPLPGLRFAAPKAKASVLARSKQKGLRVSFAEKDGALYVRIDGRADTIERRASEVKRHLHVSPLSVMQITSKLRAAGDTTVDAQGVQVMLDRMVRMGEAVKQEGGTFKLLVKRAA